MEEKRARFSREDEGDRTREKILEVALDLFARQGYHQTSITQIVKNSGSYRSAIEWHFGGKEGLLLAVLDYYFEVKLINDIKTRWAAFLGDHHGLASKDIFTFIFQELSNLVGENVGIILALFTLTFERMHQDPEVGVRVRKSWQQIIDIFKWLVELAQKDGFVDPRVDSGLLARSLVAFGQGTFMQWYLSPSEETAKDSYSQFLLALKIYLKIPAPKKAD